MKGQRGLVTTLPENFTFDNNGSTSTDAAIDTQMPWNTMQWSSGETSSSANFASGQTQYNPPNIPNILTSNSVNENINTNQTAPNTSSLPQDLNMCSEFGNNEDDEDCCVIERPNTEKMPLPSNESESQRISCKRKAIEPHARETGQSSGAGSSSCNISIPMQTESSSNLINNINNNEAEQANNPRLRLGVGGALSANPLSLSARGATAESYRRNFRLRINNNSHHQDHTPFPTEADVMNPDVTSSSSRHSSRLVLRNRLFDLSPSPPLDNGQSSRNTQSRWSGASSSSSSSEERNILEESTSRNTLRSISEHPMFMPGGSETVSSSRQPVNWNLGGASGSASRAGSAAAGANSSAPIRSNRSCPQYPRRLSEMVRRSLLSSSAGAEAGGQSSNHGQQNIASGSVNHGQNIPNSRSALLERHLDGAFGLPYSLRGLAAGGEGRSSVMSEIRHVLDIMRRGEASRVEDVMLLDHSVFFGMADIHDRHRDMRLDVDNMSYEELLALEDRIGNVCTGLNEEKIMSGLKQRKYVAIRAEDQAQTEPCSICREEYNDGEDLGTLDCDHDFHKDCIKQWLMQKNLCPICKTTGLSK